MNIRPLINIATGAILVITFHTVAMAASDGQVGYHQVGHEKMCERIKSRLAKLAEHLEIKSSQQAAWEAFSKSVESLAERRVILPNEDADAVTILRYRADTTSEFAKKLTGIADATAQLQTVLTEDQRIILNQAARHFLNHKHGWNNMSHFEGHESYRNEPSGGITSAVE